ncbi:MAG: sigma-70 family RNA polymerase sigma factor [Solirubrobacterales bacterium]|nr:sigma-70 family RNA polymerase sigma factor [Solirubrobacterales bacterium]
MSPRLSDLFLGSQSDERLVSLARAGHDRAFVAIVERYNAELHALARRLCSDGRAEDIVQQTFLSAFAALRSGAEVKHLRAWLYRIARNAATRARVPASVPLDRMTASAETVEEIVQQRAVALTALNELGRLPMRQRQAMVDTALEGIPRAEVAREMGLSEGAVRQLVHRARVALRTAVTAVTPWPVARWFAAMHPGVPGTSELAAGAGATSTGGVAIKLGALLASGTLITGVAAVDLHRAPARPHGAHSATQGARSAAQVHMRGAADGPRAGTTVSAALGLAVAPRLAAAPKLAAAPGPAAAPRIVRIGVPASRSVARSGTGAGALRLGGARHEGRSGGSGPRREGRSDSGHPDGTNPGGGAGSARHGGDTSLSSLGSSTGPRGGGGGDAAGSGGGSGGSGRDFAEPAGSIASAAGSDGRHGDQTMPESHHLDSAVVRSAPDSGGGGSRGGSGGSDGGSGGGSAALG